MRQQRRRRKPQFILSILALWLAWPGASQLVTASEGLAAWFKDPPAPYRSWPLYWLNAPLDPAALREQIRAMRDQCGFGGFAPLTLRTAKPDYLTEGYFERYGVMLEMAEKLGLKVIFYDDINFPTGTAGGRLAKAFPDSTLKNLRKVEKEFTGPGPVELAVPGGTLMAAVSDAAYRIRIEVSGTTIRTYVKGVLVDVTVDDAVRQGGIGFRESSNERAGVARLKVTSPEGKILFQDDFDSGLQQWINTQNASVSNGWLTVGENHAMRSRVGADWKDYVIEAELSTNHAPAGLVFRASVEGRNHYMWQFWPAKNQLRPHKLVDGRYWVIKDIPCVDVDESAKPFVTQANARGGKAYFAANPTAGTLQSILEDALPVADVAFENAPEASSGGGMLSYLHKVKDGSGIYYFANSSNDRVDTWVRLRGKHTLQTWDPHTGAMTPTECPNERLKAQDITRVHLILEPVKSVFLVAPPPTASDPPQVTK